MKSEKYWDQRAEDRMLDIELMGNVYADRLTGFYLAAAAQIEADMLYLFRRYREQGALTAEEAAAMLKEPVDRATWEMLRQRIDAVKDDDVRRRLMAEMNAGAVRARLNRQQAALLDLRARCAQLAQQEIPLHTEAYTQTVEEMYLRNVFDTLQEAADKVGEPVALPPSVPEIMPQDTIDDLLADRWSGQNFSDRVWSNTGAMAERLADILRTNMETGRSWRRCLDEMKDFAAQPGQGALYAAQRLLRTETNRIANQTALRTMQDMGIKHYRYIATLDARTSEICQRHDGRIDPDTGKSYEVAKAKTGVNVPPLHPNCRSTIAATVDGDTLDGLKRAARDPVTGKSVPVDAEMTYPEWLRSVLQQPNITATTKERLLGGKKKRILFDAGVLEPDDYSTPWKTLEQRGMIVPNDSVVRHSDFGEFSPAGRMESGGHGQRNIEELLRLNITPVIQRTEANGVRFGNVPGHKNRNCAERGGQSWFPESWSTYDIQLAGAYTANNGTPAPASWGSVKEAEWRGVRVRVGFDDTGAPTTIHPSYEQGEN